MQLQQNIRWRFPQKSESPQKTEEAGKDEFQIQELVGEASDYSDKGNWLKIPEITKPVDTIYLYPTCNMEDSEKARPICGIDDAAMRTGAQNIYESQTTVFEEVTNVFAPYYRQSNMNDVSGLAGAELEKFQREPQGKCSIKSAELFRKK